MLRRLVLDCEAVTDIDVTGSLARHETLTSCDDGASPWRCHRCVTTSPRTLAHYRLLERVGDYDSKRNRRRGRLDQHSVRCLS